VQLRHPPVIAVEESQEILGQIALVPWSSADDAEVHRDVLAGAL
jgi:hypothetical protein